MAIYRNQRLFSDHYLKEILPQTIEWSYIDEERLKKNFAKIQSLYEKKKNRIPCLKESQLEEEFIRPILRILDHIYTPHPSIYKMWEGAREPDYAFYSSEDAKKETSIEKAIAIGEAKRYGRPLDKKLKDEDPFEVQNPSLQMSRYLWLSEVHWGILTDGRFWRIYERETSKRIDIFYEIDLEILLKKGTIKDFKYFYLFFRQEAFPQFLQKVYTESLDYAEKVGGELKENIYQALKILAEGFLKTPGNSLTPDNLKEIHDNCLIFLYRLLFILYAEYRRLLPLDENKAYTDSYSLDSIKKEIRDKIDHNFSLLHTQTHYWGRLKELFELISSGNTEIGVPFYNGGLFDPRKHPFLEKYKVANFYIAKVIDLLARSKDKAFIDYSSLEIRHLGSIYEGLLEYKIRVAEEDLVPMKRKGKEIFVPLKEAKTSGNRIKESEIIKNGQLHLVTDKGERKASGSYYTPEYIVKYIVEKTLGPVIEEKKKLINERMQKLQEKFKKSRGYNREVFENQLEQIGDELINEILSIKVLDPAMGSGHFLVEATDFLAHTLTEVLNGEMVLEPSKKEWLIRDKATVFGEGRAEDDIRWIRRAVIERCIYGVDLNPLAVELAKLSLWLYTIAKGKPLNFLDHHLKCGNSLIGARIDDLTKLPKSKKKKREKASATQELPFDISPMTVDLGRAVGNYILIKDKLSNSLEDIKDKEKIYEDINREWIDKWRRVADLWTSSYFEIELDSNLYKALSDYLLGKSKRIPEEWVRNFADKANKVAREKRFFHWEFEFPEVFFDIQGKRLDNPGFDVVLGNPPWVVSAILPGDKVSYYQDAYLKSGDLYSYFIEKMLGLYKNQFSFVCPRFFMFNRALEYLRKDIIENVTINLLVDAGKAFSKVQSECMIFVFEHRAPKDPYTIGVKKWNDTGQLLNENYMQSELLKEMPNFMFNILLPVNWLPTVEKIKSNSILLRRLCKSKRGMELGRGALIKNTGLPVMIGEEVLKYSPCLPGGVIDKNEAEIQRFTKELYAPWRIFVRRVGKPLTVTIDHKGIPFLKNLYALTPIREGLNPFFLMSILNSKLLSEFFKVYFTTKKEKLFPEVQKYQLDQLPIRRILFTTPEEKRENLVGEGKELCRDCLANGNWDSLIFFVDQRLKKQYSPNPELVKKHNADLLNKDFQIKEGEVVEQSDVVHDILAFLAEKMVEYNEEKNKEIKSFLKWLEREAEAKVEDLTGKTKIKKYHGNTLDDLISVLKKNRKKLQIDPSRRSFQDKLSAEFDKSIQKLAPLKRKIKMTDRLIDQIVYKLYGLTEEEIKIVEENF